MILRQNNTLKFYDDDMETMDEIPKGNWLLNQNPQTGEFSLEKADDFKIPKKIYGDYEKFADRYLNTYRAGSANLGVLLCGTKGTGKSLTAKLTCEKSHLPVIMITAPYGGTGFHQFMTGIKQDCVVLIDEFEKIFNNDRGQQEGFLALLDGIVADKKLYLFTSNEMGRVNTFMLNRPGRIHYLKEYESLEFEVIEDVCNDILKDKTKVEDVTGVCALMGKVTMDILLALIKEVNLYGEDAKTALTYLNIQPEKCRYSVEVFHRGRKIGSDSVGNHPLQSETLNLEYYVQNNYEKDWEEYCNRNVETEDESDKQSTENAIQNAMARLKQANPEAAKNARKLVEKFDDDGDVIDEEEYSTYRYEKIVIAKAKVTTKKDRINIEYKGKSYRFKPTTTYSYVF